MRRLLLPLLCLLVTACGSRPVQTPAAVTDTRSFMAKAMQAYDDNRYAEARSFFGRALMEYRSVDDLQGQAQTLIDLADSALLQGDVPAARDYLAEVRALAARPALSALAPRVTLLSTYADLQSADPGSAATALDGLLNDGTTPADIRRAALFARTQAAYDLKAQDAAQWLAKLDQAEGGDADPLAAARLARLKARAEGDPAKAVALYADALKRYQLAYYRPGIAAAHEEWGGLLLAHQDWSGARDHLRRALQVRLWMVDAADSERILAALEQADAALKDDAAAKQDAEWMDYLKTGGDPSQPPPPANP
jgi:hypothetical protein